LTICGTSRIWLPQAFSLRLLLTASPPAVQRSIDISWPPGSQQQTRRNCGQRPAARYNKTWDRETDGQTEA